MTSNAREACRLSSWFFQVPGRIFMETRGKREAPAQNLTLKHLVITDSGAGGNEDGIKLSGIRHFRIENCRIERWGQKGSGIDHVGCSDGVISDSLLVHENLPTGSGVQAKGGSRNISILRTRFVNAGGRSVNLGGSTGLAYFRPRDAPFEAKNLAVIDCHFTGSTAPIAFVGIDGGLVRNCTLENPARWAVRILQESTDDRFVRCRDGIFERNRIFYDPGQISTLVNVGAETESESFRFRGNLWLSENDEAPDSADKPKLPVPEIDGSSSKDAAGAQGAGVRWLHPQVKGWGPDSARDKKKEK